MKLHLGSGRKRIPGYRNVDADAACGPDVVATVDDLCELEDKSVSAIYACHVLEHTHREKVGAVLAEWHRVLKPGGELRVAVPDFQTIVRLYNEGTHLERIWGLFYGGNKSEWDSHKVIFDYETLCTYLQKAGFHSMRRYEPSGWLSGVFEEKASLANYRDYNAYIDFSTAVVNDQLISLNVVAVAK